MLNMFDLNINKIPKKKKNIYKILKLKICILVKTKTKQKKTKQKSQ